MSYDKFRINCKIFLFMNEDPQIPNSTCNLHVISYLILFLVSFYFLYTFINITDASKKLTIYLLLIYIFLYILYKLSQQLEIYIQRFSVYFCLLFITLAGLHFISVFIGHKHTDPDSARYLLSTVIQSEATIFALVMTLSLIAVQQTASSYSIRTIEIFKNPKVNSDFYLLLFIYILMMTYNLWVLKQIDENENNILMDFENTILFRDFELQIEIVYDLAVYGFVILIPYSFHTLDLLKPATIIGSLSREINAKSLQHLVSDKWKEDNPIHQTDQIIYSSLASRDYITAKEGIKAINKRVVDLLSSENFKNECEEKITKNLIISNKKIGKYAIFQGDQDSVAEVINNIELIAKMSITKQNGEIVFKDISSSLEEMCRLAIFYKDYELVLTILNSFMYIVNLANDKLSDDKKNYLIKEIQISLHKIAKIFGEFDMVHELRLVAEYFSTIAEKIINEKMNYRLLYDNLDYINEIKEVAFNLKKEDLIIETSLSLQNIAMILIPYVDASQQFAVRCALKSLVDIHKKSVLNNYSHVKLKIELIIESINKDVTYYELSDLKEILII